MELSVSRVMASRPKGNCLNGPALPATWRRGKKPPTPAGRQKSNCTRTKRYASNSPDQRRAQGEAASTTLAPPDGGSPRATQGKSTTEWTGNEPRSTRPYSTVPLPVPSPRMGRGKGQRRSKHPGRHGREGRDPGIRDSSEAKDGAGRQSPWWDEGDDQ
ncbi:hypothetical protein GWK47_042836 [Chionoecetes opilio]|uniref:Uncharacterized protein n=1 Tax=Chionoecetes opilio TaxID=41210 RepID=A0A8J4YA09_CHIOP|nr:hypothetical protein GWK47_042836 [Chionoecetes opilio]